MYLSHIQAVYRSDKWNLVNNKLFLGVYLYISTCFDSSSTKGLCHPCFHTCQLYFCKQIKTKLFFSELADPMQVLLVKLHT